MNEQLSPHPGKRAYNVPCCCGLGLPWGAVFWGGAFILIGGAWLLHDLGLVAAGWTGLLLPLLLVIYGLFMLIGVARQGS